MSFLKKIWRPVTALALLFVLIQRGPFKVDQIQFALSQKNILFLGLLVFSTQLVLYTARWLIFTNQVTSLSFKQAFRLTLIGQFFSFFIPGGVGGDVVKALEMSHETHVGRADALSTVIADRVFGLFAMVGLSALFLAIEYFNNPSEAIWYYFLVNLVLFTGLTFGLLFTPAVLQKLQPLFANRPIYILKKIEKFLGIFHLALNCFRRPSIQIKNLIVCAALQVLTVYFIYAVVQVLNIETPSFLVFFALCCFGFVATAIPLTPAGIGVGQAAFYFLFSRFSDRLGEASVTALSLFQLFTLFFALFGGVLFAFKSKKEKAGSHASKTPI